MPKKLFLITKSSISRTFILLVTSWCVFCHPQSIRLPDLQNTAPPLEVNSLEQRNHFPRSIPSTPDVYSRNNVEDTIREVEIMLKANPTLPRLTRGEILDLLENITKADKAKSSDEGRWRDPKAIMVVKPYTPANDNIKSMEELFTKPPVTQIVGNEPLKKVGDNYNFKRIPLDIPEIDASKEPAALENELSNTPSTSTTPVTVSKHPPKKTGHKRRRPAPPTAGNSPTSVPNPTTYHPTRRPIRRRPTTTERYPNHKYPDDLLTSTALPSHGLKVIDAPKFNPSDLNEDLQMVEYRPSSAVIGEVQKHNTADVGLASTTTSSLIDLVPEVETSSTTKRPPEKQEEDEIKKMLASFGVLPVRSTTTTTSVPDISQVADNLSPDMRELLKSFGLISDTNESSQGSVSSTTEEVFGFNPVKAEVKPDAYAGFKPLPEDDYSRQDMEELLARFGLGRSSRRDKSITRKERGDAVKDKELNLDVVPEQYKEVLEDIGLTDRRGKMIRSEPLTNTQHVYNPGEPQYATEEELEKLSQLIEVVRQLERLNGSTSEEDLKKIDVDGLRELVSSLNVENDITPLDEQSAPNPVNFDYGLEKNEVKRQENGTSTTTEAAATTTQESQNGDIKDLEASFGGQADAAPATEAAAVETTTPARKTGFYYLLDWNTFLDIDDQKGKRVNLRFQPKVGDPKRFYSISVP
ncbi:hypothetical protein NQ315_002195 [Exocentrus adspersus]|uniref:Uncharacterized protein n=1 Tax=Exocentrus adspersus TaxID=1586481 RepID=A0AAV8VYY9_9CUCU|nr:hypothetical protein NQ315_002195 [Exocentrus adspersus]